jgi:DNA-directed RNA polymerase subunit RPC12/RpoP
MAIVACPECAKELNVPSPLLGKRIRCTGCKAAFVAPAPSESDEPEAVEGAVPGLTCAACGAAAVVPLAPNEFSRRPGYECAMCEAQMREAGGKGAHYAVTVLGALVTLFGIGLAVFAFGAERGQLRTFSLAAVAVAVAVGVSVASWGYSQSRLPAPVGAQAPPSRAGFWIAVALFVLLFVGAVIFALMYFMQEML